MPSKVNSERSKFTERQKDKTSKEDNWGKQDKKQHREISVKRDKRKERKKDRGRA